MKFFLFPTVQSAIAEFSKIKDKLEFVVKHNTIAAETKSVVIDKLKDKVSSHISEKERAERLIKKLEDFLNG